ADHTHITYLVRHAVDRNHRAVVHLRELAFERRGLYLDDIRPGMRNRNIQLDVGVCVDDTLFQNLSVAADGDFGGARFGALIVDAESDRLQLTDDAKTGRQRQHDPTVDFVLVTG